jgi:hypothetical protein
VITTTLYLDDLLGKPGWVVEKKTDEPNTHRKATWTGTDCRILVEQALFIESWVWQVKVADTNPIVFNSESAAVEFAHHITKGQPVHGHK